MLWATLPSSPSHIQLHPARLAPEPELQVSGQDAPEGIKSFEEVDMPPALMENVKRCKYTKPTPVQVHTACTALFELACAGFASPVLCCLLAASTLSPPPCRHAAVFVLVCLLPVQVAVFGC